MSKPSQEEKWPRASKYNIQCINGHVWTALVGTDDELKAIKHAEAGFLDAVCVDSNECDECKEDLASRNRKNAYYCEDY